MIGVIALAGVVVRNSLLIIDFVLDYMKLGMPLHEAVSEAGAEGLFHQPISLIFGTVASTILTLLVVPVLLFSFLRRV